MEGSRLNYMGLEIILPQPLYSHDKRSTIQGVKKMEDSKLDDAGHRIITPGPHRYDKMSTIQGVNIEKWRIFKLHYACYRIIIQGTQR